MASTSDGSCVWANSSTPRCSQESTKSRECALFFPNCFGRTSILDEAELSTTNGSMWLKPPRRPEPLFPHMQYDVRHGRLSESSKTILNGSQHFLGAEETVQGRRANMVTDLAPAEAEAKEDEGSGQGLEADEEGTLDADPSLYLPRPVCAGHRHRPNCTHNDTYTSPWRTHRNLPKFSSRS